MKWITVSRKMGTHGSDIAKWVASDLGYRFYDTEAISQMAQELGVLESVRVRPRTWAQPIRQAFSW